ncbi:UNVERIFIED_CONTAM: hypothetical protein GTU68_063623 [Idotea baltica]|nr:hypothetical protein [Idotea baltica]
MLVLLVIFMVTAPMLQQGVDVNLPKATTEQLKGSKEQVVLSIDKDGSLFLGSKNKVALDDVGVKLNAVFKAKGGNRKVYVKADKDLDYGRVMDVMGALHKSGINEIGLVSDPKN